MHLTCEMASIFEHFPGFELFLIPSIVHAHPHADNASRQAWPVSLTTKFLEKEAHGKVSDFIPQCRDECTR